MQRSTKKYSPLILEAQHVKFLVFYIGSRVETVALISWTLNDCPKSLTYLENGKFTHLTIILIENYGFWTKLTYSKS